MKTNALLKRGIFLLLGLAGSCHLAIPKPPFSIDLISEQDKGEVNALLNKYILAFRTRSLALASEVYAHDGDLVVYGSNPSDRRLGWSQTEEYLKQYFATVDSIEIVLKERKIKVHESGDVAWFAQVLAWKEIEEGRTYTMDGLRITGVLEKRDQGWVIVQLHASGPPPTQ